MSNSRPCQVREMDLQPLTLLQGKAYSKHTDVQATWRKFGWEPVHPTPKGSTPTYQLGRNNRGEYE